MKSCASSDHRPPTSQANTTSLVRPLRPMSSGWGLFFVAAGCRQRCAVLVGTSGAWGTISPQDGDECCVNQTRQQQFPIANCRGRRDEPSPCPEPSRVGSRTFQSETPSSQDPRCRASSVVAIRVEWQATPAVTVRGRNRQPEASQQENPEKMRVKSTGPLKRGGSAAAVHH